VVAHRVPEPAAPCLFEKKPEGYDTPYPSENVASAIVAMGPSQKRLLRQLFGEIRITNGHPQEYRVRRIGNADADPRREHVKDGDPQGDARSVVS